jgi:hypothetical protein
VRPHRRPPSTPRVVLRLRGCAGRGRLPRSHASGPRAGLLARAEWEVEAVVDRGVKGKIDPMRVLTNTGYPSDIRVRIDPVMVIHKGGQKWRNYHDSR